MDDIKEFTCFDDYPLGGTPNAFNDESYFTLGNSTPREFSSNFNNGDPFALDGVQTPSASLPALFTAQQDGTIEPNAMWNTSMPDDSVDFNDNSIPHYDFNPSTRIDSMTVAPAQVAPPVTSNPIPELNQSREPQQSSLSSAKSTRASQQSSCAPSSTEGDARSSRGKRSVTVEENGANGGDAAPPKKRQRRGRKKGPEPSKEELERKKEAFLERNRQAASRCRQKKKVEHGSLEETARQKKHERDYNQSILNELMEEREKLRDMLIAHVDCPDIRSWMNGRERPISQVPTAYHSHAASPQTMIDPALQAENSPDHQASWLQDMSPVAMSRTNSNTSTGSPAHVLFTGRHNSVGINSVMAQHNAVHRRNNSMPTSMLQTSLSPIQRAMNPAPYPIPTGTPVQPFDGISNFAAANLRVAANFLATSLPHRDSGVCVDQLKSDSEVEPKSQGDDIMKGLHSPQIHAAMAAAPRAAMAD